MCLLIYENLHSIIVCQQLILFHFHFFLVKITLQQSPKELQMRIDIYDEVGIGGGASGVSGGLLHPYSPKGFSFSS